MTSWDDSETKFEEEVDTKNVCFMANGDDVITPRGGVNRCKANLMLSDTELKKLMQHT